MEKIYKFIAGADPIRRVKSQAYILEQISLQTFECARFIVRYADKKNFCQLWYLSDLSLSDILPVRVTDGARGLV